MSVAKNELRPLYSELQGYLSQTPPPEGSSDVFGGDSVWQTYNQAVAEIEGKTGQNYDRFKIKPERNQGQSWVCIATFRTAVGGLISRLHGEYFSDEMAPFSGMPSTVINQTQSQSLSIQMYLDIQSKIDERIHSGEVDGPEKDFLGEFKSVLGTAIGITDIFKQCFRLAKDYGILNTLIQYAGENSTRCWVTAR